MTNIPGPCVTPPPPQDMPQDQLTSTPGTEQVKFVVTPPDENGQSDLSADTPVVIATDTPAIERQLSADSVKETPETTIEEDNVEQKGKEDVPLEKPNTVQNGDVDNPVNPVTDHAQDTPSLEVTTVTKQEEGVSTTVESNTPETPSDVGELKEDVPLPDTPTIEEGVAGDTPPSDTPPVEEEPPKPDTPPLDKDDGDIPSTPPKEEVSLPQQQLDPVEEISEGDKDQQEEPPVVVKSKPPSTPGGLTTPPDKR